MNDPITHAPITVGEILNDLWHIGMRIRSARNEKERAVWEVARAHKCELLKQARLEAHRAWVRRDARG